MTTEKINTTELFATLDETWHELLQMVSSTGETAINNIPFKDSWTVAQVTTHITKSNKAIAKSLNMEGTPAERDPQKGVPYIKEMFLDFTAKYQSPEFIVPEKDNYNKEAVIETLKKSINKLKDIRNKTNLIEIIKLPIFGEVTKLELLYFVLYHTQRHLHQLKNIFKALRTDKNIITENFKKQVDEYNSLWQQLKFEEAIEKFCDKDVIAVDNEDKPANGSAEYKKLMNRFLKESSDISARIKNVIVSEDMSVTEWHRKFDFKDQGTTEFDQLSLQRWKNGRIYHERHYYNKD